MTRPRFLMVMPWVVPEYAQTAMDSHRFSEAGRVMYVDNSKINKGIMRSHNEAIDELGPDDWLITVSAALKFGTPGGLDFIDLLEERGSDYGVISALDTFGWHCIAFRSDVVQAMGRYDENFTPYGYDDVDLSIRIFKQMPDLARGAFPIDVHDRGMAHSIVHGGVTSPVTHLDYFIHKWGVMTGSEYHEYRDHPFGNPDNHINFWPTRNGAAWNSKAPGWWRG